MASDLIQTVRYPGITNGVREMRYVCSHGGGPGKVFITTNPQDAEPASFGTLTFSDGVRGVALKNCRVSFLRGDTSLTARVFTIILDDERWLWGNAPVRAKFNQVQEHDGKLVPWTIASPTEIATYLLQTAGVTNFKIVLPAGLPSSVGQRATDYLRPGQFFPNTRTNPPVSWDGIPAMQALTEFVARFGCRVIYQPCVGGRILIAPLGGSFSVPAGGIRQRNLGIENEALPKSVILYGAETLHQMRVPLEPVGKEWNEVFMHINDLSYAPVTISRKLVIEGKSTHPAKSAHRAEFKLADPEKPSDETKTTWFTITSTTLSALQVAIAADSRLKQHVESCLLIGTDTIRITGKDARFFAIDWRLSGPGLPPRAKLQGKTTSTPGLKKPGWGYCAPPLFAGVQAVPDHLSRDEAVDLCRLHVWKSYRLVNCAPDLLKVLQAARAERDPKKWPLLQPLTVPGFGRTVKGSVGAGTTLGPAYKGGTILRRQQIVPTKDMVDRLTPTTRQFDAIQPGTNPFAGSRNTVLPDFYNGTSQAAPAVVRGSYANLCGSVKWLVSDEKGQKSVNSPPNSRVYTSWGIDLKNQLVTFSDYVYKLIPCGNGLYYDEPDLIYEGGCYVQDPNTNVPYRYTQELALGGFAPSVGEIFDDVVVSWVGKYDENNRLTKAVQTDFGDGFLRARDYLAGMLTPYQTKATAKYEYAGIRKIDPDGALQQVTWNLGTQGGPGTIISLNSETSTVIPAWGARQLAENLPPNQINRLLNARENPGGVGNEVKKMARGVLPAGLSNALGL